MAKYSLIESSAFTHSILEAFVQNVKAQRVGRAENAQLLVAFHCQFASPVRAPVCLPKEWAGDGSPVHLGQ